MKKIKATKIDSNKLIRPNRNDHSFTSHTPDEEFELSLSPEKSKR